MGREFELKYSADGAKLTEIQLAHGTFDSITMETNYYDDFGHNLSTRHWTLRRRMENEECICTLKIDLPDGSRGEWEVFSLSIDSAIPALVKSGAPEELAEFAKKGLYQSCGAKFLRKRKMVRTRDGEAELALDEGVLLGGGKELPFAEVEVELKSGSDQATREFAEKIATQYALEIQPLSKLRRALALAYDQN